MGDNSVSVERDEGIAVVTLARGPVNALDVAMQIDLTNIALDLSCDSSVGCVIIYGGPSVFAAGGDLKELAAMTYRQVLETTWVRQKMFAAIHEIPKPVIAAIDGDAIGGGCELALAADFRLCTPSARLGLPEIRLGLIPGGGGTQLLPRIVGLSVAKRMIYSGETIDAQLALEVGLVERVVESDELIVTAKSYASEFLKYSLTALGAAKEALHRSTELGLDAGFALERSLFTGLFPTEEATHAIKRFSH